MRAKEITGVVMAATGLAGVIYSGVGMFDNDVYRNSLAGVVLVAMFLLLTGILLTKSAVERAAN